MLVVEEIFNVKNATRGGFDPRHDLQQFVSYLHRLKISDRTKNVEALKQLKQLKYQIRNSHKPLESFLKHPFFDPLKKKPKDVSTFEYEAKEEPVTNILTPRKRL